jgi:hypothetical protein
MPPPVASPAVRRFIERLPDVSPVAQVQVTRLEHGFELRHVQDTDRPDDALRIVDVCDLRELARFNDAGQFRSLKSAPDLRAGWLCVVAGPEHLDRALSELYPGFLADWHAVEGGFPPVTHFRSFVSRQTGLYRRVADLDDAEAAAVIRACCAREVCLKRRWWTVKGLPPDAASGKSLVPCLEPCALFLDLARLAVAHEDVPAPVPDNGQQEALVRAVETPDPAVPAADFEHPANPRRARWLLERHVLALAKPAGEA